MPNLGLVSFRPTGVGIPAATGRAVTLAWVLLALFALRVLGQAVQRWLPQPFLPPFDSFQGSALPYWALLSAQLAILAAMLRGLFRARRGALSDGSQRAMALGGRVYLAAALGRIAIGLELPGAPAWFSAWIPAAFHVVLASFVLTLHSVQRRAGAIEGAP